MFLPPPPRQVGGGKKRTTTYCESFFRESEKTQKQSARKRFRFCYFCLLFLCQILKMWRKYEERENLVPYTLLLAAFGSYAKVLVVGFFFFTTPVLLWCVPPARGNGVGFFPWNFPKQKTNRAGPGSTINDEILFLLHVHILSIADNRTLRTYSVAYPQEKK